MKPGRRGNLIIFQPEAEGVVSADPPRADKVFTGLLRYARNDKG